jgi:hypothetical protein
MALTLLEAAKLSRNPLAAGVLTAVATSDELISQVLMEPTAGESVVYNREKTLATAEFVQPNHTSLTESSTSFDKVMVPMRLLVTDLDIYNFASEQMGDTNNQQAQQLALKLKAVGRTIASKMISGVYVTSATVANSGVSPGAALSAIVVGPTQDSDRHGAGKIKYTHTGQLWQYCAPGDVEYGAQVAATSNGTYTLRSSNQNRYITVTITTASATANGETLIYFSSTSNEPDGLKQLVDTAQVVSSTGASGDDLSLDALDQLIDEKVKVRNRRVFVMNSKVKRKYFQLVRGLGGVAAEVVTLPGVTGAVPSYRGIPILQNDWIASDESKGGATTLSSVYLIDLSTEGFHAYCGQGGSSVNVMADPISTRIMGLKVRDVGQLPDKEADRTRVSWYGTFALKSALALARAKEIKTA